MPTPSLDELIQTVLDRCAGETELDQLEIAVELAGELSELSDSLVNHFVETARTHGASWSQVGAALGVSKQGAQQRFQRPQVFYPRAEVLRARIRERGLRGLRGGPFTRFTGAAKAVVAAAADEAQGLGHAYVGTEHLLLAILRDKASAAVHVLEVLDAPINELRDQVAELAGPPSSVGVKGRPPFTARAKRALELSLREALRTGDGSIGTEHILLGLAAEGDGVAGRAMAHGGIDVEGLRGVLNGESSA